MRRVIFGLFVLVASLAVFSIACGGSGGSSDSEYTAVTPPDYTSWNVVSQTTNVFSGVFFGDEDRREFVVTVLDNPQTPSLTDEILKDGILEESLIILKDGRIEIDQRALTIFYYKANQYGSYELDYVEIFTSPPDWSGSKEWVRVKWYEWRFWSVWYAQEQKILTGVTLKVH